jgi:hypothetical protein
MFYADINHKKPRSDYENATYDGLIAAIVKHCSESVSYAAPEFFWQVAAIYEDRDGEIVELPETLVKEADNAVNYGIDQTKYENVHQGY